METSTRNESSEHYRIGVDLGGTKLGFAIVRIRPQNFIDDLSLVYSFKWPTFDQGTTAESLDATEHVLEKIQKGIQKCEDYATKEGLELEKRIGLGTPGKIVAGKITPKTAPFLGPKFDNLDIKTQLTSLTEKEFAIQNDALAQMAAAILMLLKQQTLTREDFAEDNRIGYIGPGTGLGGGFARLYFDGSKIEIQPFTDGHIGDLLIAGKTAEQDLLSGTYIQTSLGISGMELNEALEKNQHIDFANSLGNHLGMIVESLTEGNVEKAREETKWSRDDIQAVKGISKFIIGGSVSSKGRLGSIIINEANKYLIRKKLGTVRLYPVPTNSTEAGMLGAAAFAEYVRN